MLCLCVSCCGVLHYAAGQHLQWTLPFAAGAAQVRPLQQLPGSKARGGGGGGDMDSGSRSSAGAGFDDDDGLAARREVSSSLKGTPSIPLNLFRIRVCRCCRVKQWWNNVIVSWNFDDFDPIVIFFLSRGRTILVLIGGSASCWFSRVDG